MLNKISGKKTFFTCIIINGLLGCINLLLNYQSLIDTVGDSKIKFIITFIVCFVSAFVVQASYVIALNLIVYFSAAALNKGFDFKTLLGLSSKALLLTPYLTFVDTVSYILTGKKIISLGTIGLLSYIPFYATVGIIMFQLFPYYLVLAKKHRIIISIVASILMIGISYPYI